MINAIQNKVFKDSFEKYDELIELKKFNEMELLKIQAELFNFPPENIKAESLLEIKNFLT